MKYRKLGKWGLKVSQIALGSWMTDITSSDKTDVARQVIAQAYDAGVNFFDCADNYGRGAAEQFLGSALKGLPREKLILSSKVFFPVGDGPNDRGLSRKHIFTQIDRSLKNLQVDYLDLYFCHRADPDTPMEETLQAMSDLVAQGKVLYYGMSEWSPVQLTKALGIVKELRLRPFSVIQPQYHMLDRYIEDEIMEICRENGIGIVSFSPLSQGLLSGKYRLGQPIPEGSRATRQKDKQINLMLTEENLEKVEQLLKVAEELGVSLPVLALSWALRRPEITSVINGASSPAQLQNNLAAGEFTIPADAMERIEEILDYHPFKRKVNQGIPFKPAPPAAEQ
jgi:aryl-alcohol dehydrogenase-like predicted oxidoreductase